MTSIQTERLQLRNLAVSDAPFILQLLNEPSFLHYIGDKGVRTIDDAKQYILNGPIASYKEHGFGLYIVELKTGPTPIGMCGLIKRTELPEPDIGFAFMPDYWSRGFAFESALAVINYAVDVLQLKRILAITSPDNEPSAKLLTKLGLEYQCMYCLSEDRPEVKLFEKNFVQAEH
jgi:RimJ/RimL family protein N-acetyltransferase